MIAHKGAAIDGPENTLGAIKKAADNGFDGVEFDVMLTRDKVAVLIHDQTVDRTTDGRGRVKDFSLKEISQLNAAAKFDGDWAKSEAVPLMVDAVDMALHNNLFIVFDVKDTDNQTLDQVLEQFKKHDQLYRRSVISSFDFTFLYRVQRRDKRVAVVPIFEPFTLGEIKHHKGLSYAIRVIPEIIRQAFLHVMFYYINPICLDHQLVSVSHELVDDNFLQWAEDWGKDVVAWTVNDDQTKFEFIHKKRVSVITDSISQITPSFEGSL